MLLLSSSYFSFIFLTDSFRKSFLPESGLLSIGGGFCGAAKVVVEGVCSSSFLADFFSNCFINPRIFVFLGAGGGLTFLCVTL